MTIYNGSRYENSYIDFFAVEAGGDENPTVFYDFPDIGQISYYEHVYVDGERLDSIAHKYYERPSLWWLILDHNPELVDMFNIPVGTKLRVPRV